MKAIAKIKICGLGSLADIEAVNELLPEFIGFVFAPGKRQVSAARAAELKEQLDPQIRAVGVFVNEKPETVAAIVRAGTIDMVQLHGDEDVSYVNKLKLLAEAPLIRAIRLRKAFCRSEWEHYPCDYYLFDTYSEQVYGGSGRTFAYSLLEGIPVDKPFFVAGGLSESNVAEAVRRFSPYGVDVSGGVETEGRKDKQKIERFIAAGRNVAEND